MNRKATDRLYDRTAKGKFRAGRTRARRRGVEWTLTLTEYEVLIGGGRCHYCDGALDETGSSLDRLDSSKGYVMGNVVPSCWRCNRIKSEGVSERDMRIIAAVLKVVKEWE